MLSDFLDLVYPRLCLLCTGHLSAGEELICISCLYQLPKTGFMNNPENKMAKGFWGRVELQYASAFLEFRKGNKVQELLHLLKYKRKKNLGIVMGKILGLQLKENMTMLPDALIPVPLHKEKKVLRGYNQSLMLAMGIKDILNIPILELPLQRLTANETQTRKTRYARWINVKEIFALEHPELIENKHLLLVDDVYTTGATLEACAQCLLEGQDVKVSAAALACTV